MPIPCYIPASNQAAGLSVDHKYEGITETKSAGHC